MWYYSSNTIVVFIFLKSLFPFAEFQRVEKFKKSNVLILYLYLVAVAFKNKLCHVESHFNLFV